MSEDCLHQSAYTIIRITEAANNYSLGKLSELQWSRIYIMNNLTSNAHGWLRLNIFVNVILPNLMALVLQQH